jgi:hypothetical protein
MGSHGERAVKKYPLVRGATAQPSGDCFEWRQNQPSISAIAEAIRIFELLPNMRITPLTRIRRPTKKAAALPLEQP